MSLPRVIVDGVPRQVVSRSPARVTVATEFWLATLLLRDGASLPGASVTRLEETDDRALLQHGRNTWSYLSPHGAWIVCGPWRSFVDALVRRVVDEREVLGFASVERQWQYRRGACEPMAARLTEHVCREIPGWGRLTPTRRDEVHADIAALARSFLARAPGAALGEGAPLILEPYPGRATLAPRLVPDAGVELDARDVEATEPRGGEPHREALDYWWQSVFSMWWKGFW